MIELDDKNNIILQSAQESNMVEHVPAILAVATIAAVLLPSINMYIATEFGMVVTALAGMTTLSQHIPLLTLGTHAQRGLL